MARRRQEIFMIDRNPHRVRRFLGLFFLTLLMLGLITFAANFAVTRDVTLENVYVTVADLPEDLENYSILHLSDLHGAVYGERQSGIRTALGNERFSLCVMTGDMLGSDGDWDALEQILEILPDDLIKVCVPGDEDPPYLVPTAHGSVSPLAAWAEWIEKRGVTVLDAPMLITRGKNGRARLWLIPESIYALDLEALRRSNQAQLDNLNAITALSPDQAAAKRVAQYQLARVEKIRAAIRDMKPTDIQIVLTHAPLTAEYAQTLRGWSERGDVFTIRQSALVLAGHLCGGQWRLPWLGAVHVPDYGWFPDDSLVSGIGWPGGIRQYISPGLGASGAYPWWQSFRLFNRPIMTKIYLTARERGR